MSELEVEARKPTGCSHTVMQRLSDNEIVTVAHLNHQHLSNRENIIDVMRLLANFSPSIDRVHVTSQGVQYHQWGEWWLVKHGEFLILSGDDVTHIRDAGHVSRNYSNKLHYSGQL